VGVITGSLIIYFTDWFWLDPIVSLIIALIIMAAAWRIAREAIDTIVEASPQHLNMDELVQTITSLPGVRNVHDLHVWSLTPQLHAMSCHVQVDDSLLSQQSTLLNKLQELLFRRYNMCHTTIQLECPGCEIDALYCQIGPNPTNHNHTADKIREEN